MTTWIAFLRGLNVGGHRLTNDELAAAFTAVGATDVSTFLASGNVVFAGLGEDEQAVTTALEDGLRRSLGYDVPTFLRTAAEVVGLADERPFDEVELDRDGKPQVVFVRDAEVLTPATVEDLTPDGELLVRQDRALHWLPAGGYKDARLDLAVLDDLVGAHTVRTHNTVRRLTDRFLRED